MSKVFRDFSRKLRAPINRFIALKKLDKFHQIDRDINEIVDTGVNLGTRGLFKVNSVQKRSEILSLVEHVKSLVPENILEIGTYNGGTLFMWANLAKRKVVTCDLRNPLHRAELYKRFPSDASDCQVVTLEGDSHDAKFKDKVYTEFDGEKVDFLFIDGDHTEAGVEADFNSYKDLVRKGGIIAFHDILKKQPVKNNQVYYFWEKIKKNYKYKEFIDDPEQCGFGIGILYV
ncbi:MAG: class I SAM-dependent methyltransferase [Gammaproteobacteria bacterium]|nr:class I SAM-dependent methyltransferase [Gammaproteobacteria bacterium]